MANWLVTQLYQTVKSWFRKWTTGASQFCNRQCNMGQSETISPGAMRCMLLKTGYKRWWFIKDTLFLHDFPGANSLWTGRSYKSWYTTNASVCICSQQHKAMDPSYGYTGTDYQVSEGDHMVWGVYLAWTENPGERWTTYRYQILPKR